MKKNKGNKHPQNCMLLLRAKSSQVDISEMPFFWLLFSHSISKRENELIFAIFTLTTLALLVNCAPSSPSSMELL